MGRPSSGTKFAARSRNSSRALSTSASAILTSSISTSRSLYCPSSNSGSTSNVARNFTGPVSAKSTLSICGCVTGTILFSLTARSIWLGTSDCRISDLISSANLRRISVTGAFPGRNPGTRATRANSRATFSTAFRTSSAGISSSSSRRQVASVIVWSSYSQAAVLGAGLAPKPPGCRYFYFYSLPLLGPEKGNGKELQAGTTKSKYRGIQQRRQHGQQRLRNKNWVVGYFHAAELHPSPPSGFSGYLQPIFPALPPCLVQGKRDRLRCERPSGTPSNTK